MENTEFVMCIISSPGEEALRIAGTIIEKKLAACAQVSSPIMSIYWWEGKINTGTEVLIYLKTRRLLVTSIENLLKDIHPYQVPEFVVIPLIDGNPDYFKWINDVTTVFQGTE